MCHMQLHANNLILKEQDTEIYRPLSYAYFHNEPNVETAYDITYYVYSKCG